jgi:hypothetical protein
MNEILILSGGRGGFGGGRGGSRGGRGGARGGRGGARGGARVMVEPHRHAGILPNFYNVLRQVCLLPEGKKMYW